jgi:hypothetical protein
LKDAILDLNVRKHLRWRFVLNFKIEFRRPRHLVLTFKTKIPIFSLKRAKKMASEKVENSG